MCVLIIAGGARHRAGGKARRAVRHRLWPGPSHKTGAACRLFLLTAVNRWSLTAPVETGDQPARRRLVRCSRDGDRSSDLGSGIRLALHAAAACGHRACDLASHGPYPWREGDGGALDWPGRTGPVTVVANLLNGDIAAIDPKDVFNAGRERGRVARGRHYHPSAGTLMLAAGFSTTGSAFVGSKTTISGSIQVSGLAAGICGPQVWQY